MTETTFLANQEVWERIYSSGGSFLRYPDEHLVKIVHRRLNPQRDRRVLDWGFGSGNNLIHLLEAGFDCYGCEISPAAINVTSRRLRERNLSAKLILLERSLFLPFEEAFFDVVISWGVLCYNDADSLDLMIGEIHRTLKPGGKLFATMLQPNDLNPSSAKYIGAHTYQVTSSPAHVGTIIFVPQNEGHLRKLFSRFQNLEIGSFGWRFGEIASSHWIIWGEKGAAKK